jgi:predicted deacylase
VQRAQVLDRVQPADLLGTVLDDLGTPLQELRAPSRGIVVMARRTARVAPGDGAYLLATEEDS